MKNIRIYNAKKYENGMYTKVKSNIYETIKQPEDDNSSLSLIEVTDSLIINILNNKDDWKNCEKKIEEDLLYTIYDGQKYYKDKNDNDDSFYQKNDNIQKIYVTSIMFEQEPNLGENNPSDKLISQYPLEDILDKFFCYCLDDYSYENETDKENSYVEFASKDINDIENLLTIIGKHVYNKQEGDYIKLIIE